MLISGHHANILKWQREQSIAETAQKRPDLLEKAIEQGKLTKKELRALEEAREAAEAE